MKSKTPFLPLLALFLTAFSLPTTYAFESSDDYEIIDIYENEAVAIYSEEDEPYAQYIFEVEKGSTQKVFIDQSNVRRQPNLSSEVIDQLAVGQEVVIIQPASVLELGLRSAHWYKVQYEKNNKTHTGYIWGANFSIGSRHLDDHDILLGVNQASNDNNNTDVDMVFKVIKDNKLKQSVTFIAYYESLNGVDFGWGRNTGLEGVSGLLTASIFSEACGIPSISKYMLWDGKRLIELPTLTSVSDADIFYHGEDYIFPNDKGGKAGHIIMQMEEEYTDEEELEIGELKMSETVIEQTLYRWLVDKDGKNGRFTKL